MRHKAAVFTLALAFCGFACVPATAQTSSGFTLEQALSSPFTIDLHAAPAHNRFVWVANSEGRRNLWVAEPAGAAWTSRQITHYSEDDGQDCMQLVWTMDANSIVYVRGSNAQGSEEGGSHPVPNPSEMAKGAKQQLWIVSADGSGQPRLLGEGRTPALSPDGKSVAYLLHGEVWTANLTGDPAPKQLLVTRGTANTLSWSPDGARLVFVSSRGDHGFIAVYTVASQKVLYLDPSSDHDSEPVWSADSKRIAFMRVPSELEEDLHGAHATAQPWSIRIADATTGSSHELWVAHAGPGSAFRETGSPQQLFWTANDTIVFPWESDGWLHLYGIPATGGPAQLLTPGNFEVEHTDLSMDRRVLAFDSNQADSDKLDVDRHHAWRLIFDRINPRPQRVTGGDGIETRPTVGSDNNTIVVFRADAHFPVHPAVVLSPTQMQDLAPQAMPASFPGAKFVTPQQVIFPSTDNLQIHGQLFVPANLGPGRHPAIVFYHGGSQRQMLLGWNAMEYYSNAYAMNQYLTSLGFIVLSVNYRSGIGYGLGFREYPGYGATGAKEFDDALAAARYLKSRPDVDAAHIGAWGGSWGGYLTAMSLAKASDLFAAGFDMEGVHNWQLEVGFPAHYDEKKRADLEALALASSPVAYVSTWRSPVLLVHGDDDRNVPFSETVRLMELLRKQHVDAEELIFPDEIHDLLLHTSWLRSYKAGADFLQRHLMNTPQH